MDNEAELGSDHEFNDEDKKNINTLDAEEILDRRLEFDEHDVEGLIDNNTKNNGNVEQLITKHVEDKLAADTKETVDIITAIKQGHRGKRNRPNTLAYGEENENGNTIYDRMGEKSSISEAPTKYKPYSRVPREPMGNLNQQNSKVDASSPDCILEALSKYQDPSEDLTSREEKIKKLLQTFIEEGLDADEQKEALAEFMIRDERRHQKKVQREMRKRITRDTFNEIKKNRINIEKSKKEREIERKKHIDRKANLRIPGTMMQSVSKLLAQRNLRHSKN